MTARYRRPSDPGTRSKDSVEGMKILAFILAVWSFGFLWLSTAGYMPYISGNYTNTVCCNVVDFCILALLIGILLRFRKEEAMKRRMTELLETQKIVTVKEMAEEFVMNPQSAVKVFHDWTKENPGKGTYDAQTGSIVKAVEEK